MSKITVQNLNPVLSMSLQNIAFAHGYKWSRCSGATVQYADRPVLQFDSHDGSISYGHGGDEGDVYECPGELGGAICWLEENPAGRCIPVTLNSEYTAEVTREHIKVGCTTMPLSVIDNLLEARRLVLK